jgi:hypothetical protein
MAEDPETLVSLLKEKAKELKLAQKKLSKVEDKYVETHKLQKALLRDRETFIQLLKVIFTEASLLKEVMLDDTADSYGLYDITQLQEFYVLLKTSTEKQHLLEKDSLQQELK